MMDLLLPVAKITPDTGMPQCIRLSQEAMNSLDVREHDPVLVIHAQHSTQAGAIVGSPLLSSANYVILDVVTRYALGAIGGHQVRVVKGNLEPGTSVVVTPRRRWKMPVEEADFRHILQDRIVAPRQRIPLIIHGIWLDFEVVSILPESQMVRVTPDTRIVVKPLVEKLAASNLVHNAELPRGTGDGPGEVQPPAAEPADPILDATDLNPEFNALPPELRPPLEVGEPSIPSDPPFEIPPATKEYYQTTWGFDPTAVLKTGQGGRFAYEAEIPLVSDDHLREAGVTMYARTQVSSQSASSNYIIFRCGGLESLVHCIHTVLHNGSIDSAYGVVDAIERRQLFPTPGSLAKLEPLEHFAALRSYCFALAEMGILKGIESTISFEDPAMFRELGFGFNSSLQQQIMTALNTVAPIVVSHQLRELILWNLDKAPAAWLQGPGGRLFARRLFLGNALVANPTLASEILQVLRAKGITLPAEGDDQQKVVSFFKYGGPRGEILNRDALLQDLRELFQRRGFNRGTPDQLRDQWRRLEERLGQWRERLDRGGPPRPPAQGPPGPPPPPPRVPPGWGPENRPQPRGPRRWDDDDLNFFAV